MHEATIRLGLGTHAVAAAVVRALAAEQADAPEGVTVTLRADGSDLVADLAAADLPTMRAAMTGVIRLADAASRSAALAVR
ncbi:MAG: KEOPS complex subunit Pcc1 [bacterium]